MKPHSHYCQDLNCPGRWNDDGCANVPSSIPGSRCEHGLIVGCEDCCICQMADQLKDGLAERERGAWQIWATPTNARRGKSALPWDCMTDEEKQDAFSLYDRASAIFAAKADERVKRALDETSAACDAIERLRKERDNARRVRDECRTSMDKAMALLAEARRARDVYKASQDSAMQCWGQCAKERDEARDEVMQLKDWKESAMQVFAEWDKVGQEALRGLNPRLGSSIPEESAKAIRAMREENARLTAQNAELVAALTRVWEIVTKWRRDVAHMTSAEAMREIAEAMGIRE